MNKFDLPTRRLRSGIATVGVIALVVTLSPISASANSSENPTPVPTVEPVDPGATPAPTEEPEAPTPTLTDEPVDPTPTPSPTPTEEVVSPPTAPDDLPAPATPAPRAPRTFADEAVQVAFDAYTAGTYVPQPTVSADALRVEVLHAADLDAATLAVGLGATTVTVVGEELLVADVPFASLEALQSVVDFVRVPVTINEAESAGVSKPSPVDFASATLGSRGSDILTKTKTSAWHAAGYKGAGVKIGIIDYFDTAAWATAKAAGEVSGYSGTYCRSNGTTCDIWSGGSPHGTAVAEVLQDMAPGAKLYLATAVTTADLKSVVDYFKSQGVKVITRSLATFMDGPGNGTGAADDVVDYAVSKGMAWFNSAGNGGVQIDSEGYPSGGYWRSQWNDPDGNGWMNFKDPRGKVSSSEYMAVTCTFFQGLRWNDWGDNRTDYDLYAYTPSGTTLIASSLADQTKGAPPIEGASLNSINCVANPWYLISIFRYAVGNGTAGDVLEVMANGQMYGFVSDKGAAGSPISDSKNAGAASIGAVDPLAGVAIGDYSSQGPTNDGRIKPDFSAGSNMASASYPGGFNGTSAATPVAAGAAATLLSLRSYYTPAQAVSYLKASAVVDRGAAGADNVFGKGELRMPAIPTVTSKAPSITGTLKVGATLTAASGTWGPAPVTLTYQWKRAGVAIPGATATRYKTTTADAGKQITVTVKGAKSGYATASRTSAARTIPLLKLTVGTVTITGTPKVGNKLTAKPGTWGPGTVTRTYAWRRNGALIAGATASTYTTKAADAGKVITVTVKGSKTGYASASRTSAGKTIQP